MITYHIPVLKDEVIAGLGIKKGNTYIDATLGGGGHAWEIIKRGGILLGLDADREAVEYVRGTFERKAIEEKIPNTWMLEQGNFRNIEEIAKKRNLNRVDGILFDLGVSSHQLDEGKRGFSYRFEDAPLDLRMNQENGEDARDVLKSLTEEDLYEVLAKFGEEERARAIAYALVRARSVGPLETIRDIVRVIEGIVPDPKERNGVLSRILQALRIVVNDELNALREGLLGAEHLLISGGRLAVISFHSLEDRIVKQFFVKGRWEVITKKPMTAGSEEVFSNRRSRSAKLRIAVKI